MQLNQINQFLGVTGANFLHRTQELQNMMLQHIDAADQIEPPITHHFAYGTYVREMFAPMGSIIIGKMHKHDHICIMLQGKAIIYSEHGTEELTAPCTFVAPRGVKRIFVVLEDLIFQNVHPTNTTDLVELEKELIIDESDLNAVQNFRNLIGLEY